MKVSEIIIGCMRWGNWGAHLSINETQNLIESAVELGFTTFDHADIYGHYTTETLFGEAFKNSNIKREDIQLISKAGIELPGGDSPYSLKSYNYSKDYILKRIDESLIKLKTDYLDLFLLHRPSPLMNPFEIADVFNELQDQGKVKHFGVSNFSTSQFSLIESQFSNLLTNQIEISVNHVDAFYDGSLDQLQMKNLRPMAWSVLGNYFSEPETEQNQRLQKIMIPLCEKYEAKENQILIAFLRKHPSQIIPIVGTSRIEGLMEFKESLLIDLEREDWFKILEASVGHEVL